MNSWTGLPFDPIVAFQISQPAPQMASIPLVISYSGTSCAPFFNRRNITHFLDLYDQFCSDYRLSECEKIYWLPWYCEFFIGKYVEILIEGAD